MTNGPGMPTTDEAIHVPRQDLLAEQSVLGAMLLSREAAVEAISIVEEGDFYRLVHGAIFRAMKFLVERDKPADFVTLGEFLHKMGKFDEVGGTAYLLTLQECVPSAVNVRHYCEIVADAARVRSIEGFGQQLVKWAQDDSLSGDELEQHLWAEAESVFGASGKTGALDMREWVRKIFARINQDEDTPVFPTGFKQIDAALDGGFLPGTMNVIAGYPKMGKTTVAMNILSRLPHGCKVGISSLEMRPEHLLSMPIGQRSGVSPRLVRRAIGRANVLSQAEMEKVGEACGDLYLRPWWIGGRDSRDVDHLIAEARKRSMSDDGLDVWMIDHAQLLRMKGAESRRVEAEQSVRRITEFALSSNACVILLSQLRKPDQDNPPRPTTHALKETAALSEDPTTVLLIHRMDKPGAKPEITLELGHNRFGPTALAYLGFDEEMQRFADGTQREET